MMIHLILAVTLAWNASVQPPAVQGYRVKLGLQPGQMDIIQDVGNVTQAQINPPPGTYYARVFAYNADGESGPSNQLQFVQAGPTPTPTPTPSPSPSPGGPTVVSNKHVAAPGETITATVTGGPAINTDLVSLVSIDPPAATAEDWKFLNGTRTRPDVGQGISSATLTFTAPLKPGTYEFRFHGYDDWRLLDRSDPIIVGSAPTPTPTPSVRAVSVKTKHMPGAQVPISAPATVNGKAFQAWTGDTGSVTNPGSANTTITVPSTLDVSVEASYQP